jgi:4-hydroxy-3-polyprenylbenzoate decarboxylase
MDPARDITVIEGTPIDYLDFAAPESGLGSKIGWMRPTNGRPRVKREWGRVIRMDDEVVRTVTEKWPKLGLPGSGKPIW